MFLNAGGSWEDLTVTEEEMREQVVWGRWERGRERANPDREKGRAREKGGGEKTFPSGDWEPVDELSCLYNFEKYI